VSRLIFRPAGAWRGFAFHPRLAPWAAFCRRFAAGLSCWPTALVPPSRAGTPAPHVLRGGPNSGWAEFEMFDEVLAGVEGNL
jgi:hypothetical protein